MNSKSTEQLLIEMENFSREENLSKRKAAAKLGISYATYKRWFLTGSSSRRNPSPPNVQKIEKFLDSLKETRTRWQELWMKILEWWKTQHRYSTVKEFADEIVWDVQRTHYLQKLHSFAFPYLPANV